MFDAGTKHLSESFPRSMWMKKLNLQNTFMCIHFSHYGHPPRFIVDTADIRKTLEIICIHFVGQWLVEIKLKELSIRTYEFLSNFVARYLYKMVALFQASLWPCKAILQVSTNIHYFFLTYTEACGGRDFSYT